MNELLSSLFEKLKSFAEIAVALVLDYILTMLMWYIKGHTDALSGFEAQQEKDHMYKWMITFSSFGLYFVLSCFIILDVAKQALKTFQQIRQQVREIFNSAP